MALTVTKRHGPTKLPKFAPKSHKCAEKCSAFAAKNKEIALKKWLKCGKRLKMLHFFAHRAIAGVKKTLD